MPLSLQDSMDRVLEELSRLLLAPGALGAGCSGYRPRAQLERVPSARQRRQPAPSPSGVGSHEGFKAFAHGFFDDLMAYHGAVVACCRDGVDSSRRTGGIDIFGAFRHTGPGVAFPSGGSGSSGCAAVPSRGCRRGRRHTPIAAQQRANGVPSCPLAGVGGVGDHVARLVEIQGGG